MRTITQIHADMIELEKQKVKVHVAYSKLTREERERACEALMARTPGREPVFHIEEIVGVA